MDHSSVNLVATIRALSDVVAPAVDAQNARAREQLALSIEHLEFLVERIDHLYERHWYELTQHFELATTLLDICSGRDVPGRAGLARAVEQASGLRRAASQAGSGAPLAMPEPVAVLGQHAERLNEAISVLVQSCVDAAEDLRRRIDLAVLKASERRIAFERIWYAPLGFDVQARALGTLREVLNSPHLEESGPAARESQG